MTRRHELGGGMREEIRLKNDSPSPVEVRVDLECDADFADLFEVRGYHRPVLRREVSRRIGGGCVTFAYQNGGFQRATRVYLSGEGVEPVYIPGGLWYVLVLGPGEERVVTASVNLLEGEREVPWTLPASLYEEAPVLERPTGRCSGAGTGVLRISDLSPSRSREDSSCRRRRVPRGSWPSSAGTPLSLPCRR